MSKPIWIAELQRDFPEHAEEILASVTTGKPLTGDSQAWASQFLRALTGVYCVRDDMVIAVENHRQALARQAIAAEPEPPQAAAKPVKEVA